MEKFREDLLDVFFVGKDGTFALEVSTPDHGEAFVIRAFERPAGGREEDSSSSARLRSASRRRMLR